MDSKQCVKFFRVLGSSEKEVGGLIALLMSCNDTFEKIKVDLIAKQDKQLKTYFKEYEVVSSDVESDEIEVLDGDSEEDPDSRKGNLNQPMK